MDWTQILIAAISGGLITKFFDYLSNKGEQKSSDFKAILDVWAIDNERLRKLEENWRDKAMDWEKKFNDLQAKITLIETIQQNFPFPMCLKDMDGTILAVNNQYERSFLIPRGYTSDDYIGSKNSSVWPEKFCQSFKQKDSSVIESGKPHFTVEDLLIGEVEKRYLTVRYLRKVGNVTVAIACIALPVENIQNQQFHREN